MELKRRLQDEDIAQKLILESDSDGHISEDDAYPPQSDTEEDRTDTGCRDWTNTRQSRPPASVIHKFTGGAQWVQTKLCTPHKQRLFATEHFHALFFS
jgi:hypothetical protein